MLPFLAALFQPKWITVHKDETAPSFFIITFKWIFVAKLLENPPSLLILIFLRLFSGNCHTFRGTFCISCNLWYNSSTQIKMSLKIIACKSLENSREKVFDGVYFSKVTRLQCKESNCTISRLHQRFFSEYAPKISCFKNNNLRKKSTVYQRFRKLWHSSVHPVVLPKQSSCKIFQTKRWKNIL